MMKSTKREGTSQSVIYSKCFAKWELDSQIDMCIEEMAELTQALCKSRRRKKPENWLANVYEEIADVSIMLNQMINVFDGEEIVPQVVDRKLARLLDELNL